MAAAAGLVAWDEHGPMFVGDAIEFLRRLEGGSVALIVADPPYNKGKNFGNNRDRRPDYEAWTAAWLDAARRAMRAAYQREVDALEAHLSGLASVGSVSPYIGLFGTVWGIMNAFRGLANVAQATLTQVAPGIAEALVATAIGLFAAIPAVVAYNRFTHDVDRLAVRFETFIEEFSNILQRQG